LADENRERPTVNAATKEFGAKPATSTCHANATRTVFSPARRAKQCFLTLDDPELEPVWGDIVED
jgi:hypothetical protein